jgi:hypothetical protein
VRKYLANYVVVQSALGCAAVAVLAIKFCCFAIGVAIVARQYGN